MHEQPARGQRKTHFFCHHLKVTLHIFAAHIIKSQEENQRGERISSHHMLRVVLGNPYDVNFSSGLLVNALNEHQLTVQN